jgi:hypothetical protein
MELAAAKHRKVCFACRSPHQRAGRCVQTTGRSRDAGIDLRGMFALMLSTMLLVVVVIVVGISVVEIGFTPERFQLIFRESVPVLRNRVQPLTSASRLKHKTGFLCLLAPIRFSS